MFTNTDWQVGYCCLVFSCQRWAVAFDGQKINKINKNDPKKWPKGLIFGWKYDLHWHRKITGHAIVSFPPITA